MNEVESDQECQCLEFFPMYCQPMYSYVDIIHTKNKMQVNKKTSTITQYFRGQRGRRGRRGI